MKQKRKHRGAGDSSCPVCGYSYDCDATCPVGVKHDERLALLKLLKENDRKPPGGTSPVLVGV